MSKMLAKMNLISVVQQLKKEDIETIQGYVETIEQENQELKKQLENCYCNRTDCSSRIKDSKQYDSLVQKVEKQQKEFIEFLEYCINELKKERMNKFENTLSLAIADVTKIILEEYKKIIGVKDEKI